MRWIPCWGPRWIPGVASCLVLLLTMTSSPAIAGKYNRVLSVGDQAPAFSKLPGTDDKTHSLKDFDDAKVVVVVFTCNTCPYAIDAEKPLIQLAKAYQAKGVQLVAINVNLVEEDRLPAMKQRAAELKLPYPYLADESQQIAKDYGAVYTPECYVLDSERKVVYMGAITGKLPGQNESVAFLSKALDAVLAGNSVQHQETPPIGCRIRLQRQRRPRK